MSTTRRGFLGGFAAGAATTLSRPASGHEHFEGYPDTYGLLHDTTLCTGCRSCEHACNEVNDLPAPGAPVDDKKVFDEPRRLTDEAYTVVNRYCGTEDGPDGETFEVFRKQQCMHCQEPCCASVCLVGAFTKTPEGPVLYDPSVCIGCRYCVMACPYYALSYEYHKPLDPRVVRCTMCYDRIKKNEAPACASKCPTGAITFGRRDELVRLAKDRIHKHPDRYVDHIFGEREFGGTSWLVLAGVDFAKLGLPAGAGPEPLPNRVTSFLGVVPLVITIYPGLLLGMHAFSQRREKLAQSERDQAVAEAVDRAKSSAECKLADAAAQAKRDKDKAIDKAVDKALAEAAKKRAEEAASVGALAEEEGR